MNLDAQIDCFGIAKDEFLASVDASLMVEFDGKFEGYRMAAMSLMSDAQTEIELGLHEAARQTLNRAKLLLSEMRKL